MLLIHGSTYPLNELINMNGKWLGLLNHHPENS